MFRNFKGIFFVIVLVILGLVTLLIPQINIGSFSRGESDSLLGLKLGLDLQGGTHLVYKFISEEDQPITPEDIEGVKKIVEKRVNEFGVSEPNVQLLGNNPPDRILVQLPGQKGISLTISFNGGGVSKDNLDRFFSSVIGINDFIISENEDGSFVVQLEKIEDTINDEIIQGWKQQLSKEFPVSISFGYSSLEEESVENITEIFNLLDNITYDNLNQMNDFENGFSLDIYNLNYDQETVGVQTNSQLKEIQSELKKLGELQFLFVEGNITQWTLSGGIQEAKRLIGSTAMLEFLYRECGDSLPEELNDIISADEWEFERCTNP